MAKWFHSMGKSIGSGRQAAPHAEPASRVPSGPTQGSVTGQLTDAGVLTATGGAAMMFHPSRAAPG
jgi:hypothetical protein